MTWRGRSLCVDVKTSQQYEDDEESRKNYTYTIITTDSNEQLKFLHDRMPVILENGSEALRTWLDPGRYEWSKVSECRDLRVFSCQGVIARHVGRARILKHLILPPPEQSPWLAIRRFTA